MNTDFKHSLDAEENCKVLERAILKYFPRPIDNMESVDTDGRVDPRPEPSLKAAPSTVLVAVRRSLSFLCLPHF